MAPRLERDRLLADRSLNGLDLCRALSAQTDGWLRDVFVAAGEPGDTALVAVGGYGRAELSPMSDIDLVLLHANRRDMRGVAESIWYPIWDEKLKLGHAVRTVKEAVALASDDLETATSLLSVRLVAGDGALAEDLASRALALWQKRSRRFLAELSRSVRDRQARAGEVAFLLEPDLKEGRGGLRDVHAIRWAEAAGSVMLRGDDSMLAAAYDTLLETRVELHRVTGRPGDRLGLEDQDAVAEDLGYGSKPTDDPATEAPSDGPPAERPASGGADALMRAVATAARDIAWTSDEIWWRVDSSLSGPSGVRVRRDRAVDEGVILREGEVHLTHDADPGADPLLLLRVAVAAAEHDTVIDRPSLDRLVADAPPLPYPWSDAARELFARIFLAGRSAIAVIETLDRKGLWVRLLPEWEPVRCRPQRNAFHTYTVDRHLCEAAVNASALVDRVDRPDLAVVGALLHDIGKGYAGDHTVVGVEVVGHIGTRMGFPPEDIAVLQEIVHNHLLLPDIATRRDLDDDSTIRRVAQAVSSLSALYLLWVVTEADSKATGPAAWNDWKAELVAELVKRTAHVLGGGAVEDVTQDRFPTDEQLAMVRNGRQLIEGHGDVLTVVAPDRPGLFSRVAGVLALNSLDVLEASAYTDDHGVALEVFRVASSVGPVIAWERVVRDTELALDGRLALGARLADRARRYSRPFVGPRPTRPPPRLTIDSEASAVATVLEVQAPDGIGVLYRITRAIADVDLDIRSAKVETRAEDVVDSFYLRDRSGRKVTDLDHLAELERAVRHSLAEER